MMQNGRITGSAVVPLSRKPKSKNMSTCFEREVSIKTKYGHRSIMYIIITTTKFIIKLLSHNFYHKLLMNK